MARGNCTMPEEDVVQVRYLTDDRDASALHELLITEGGNGDWYISVVPQGQFDMRRSVRICTSGGASMAVPGLGPAIADAFRALMNAADGTRGVTKQYRDGTRIPPESS